MAAPMVKNVIGRVLHISRCKFATHGFRNFHMSFRNRSDHPDIRKVFLNDEVQMILKRITGFDLDKINAPQLRELQESEVKLLTDQQLEELQEEACKDAEQRMVMPPVMDPRKEIDETLSDDPEIAAAVSHKMVFTDVTYGIPDRDRICVVRETDGKLRSAAWSERERMIQLYFPEEGRKLRMPKMFEEENLQRVLDEQRYLYALERACIQFEPDDPNFIRVTTSVYNHIQTHKLYDVLRSSRHFGPMAFYYARHKVIDNLLIYFLKLDEAESAADLVRLLHIMHPELKSAVQAKQQNVNDSLELVQIYCELDSSEKGPISLLLQSHKEQAMES